MYRGQTQDCNGTWFVTIAMPDGTMQRFDILGAPPADLFQDDMPMPNFGQFGRSAPVAVTDIYKVPLQLSIKPWPLYTSPSPRD